MSVAATGVGSLPGTDVAEAVRLVAGELPDLVHLPELPARGVPAAMVGRATAVLSGLAADLQPAGWRLTDAAGIDQRRAVSLLAHDLDLLEEHTQGYSGRLKVQVAGPWTLAATIERPRGDRVLADHGARRELAQSLAEGVAVHVADVRRRVPGADVLVQLDEPALPAVLAGAVPTASGFSRHRSVERPGAVEALGWVTAAVREAGAVPAVHCCAADVPVRLLHDAGATAVSFDLGQTPMSEAWSRAYEGGVDLWPGVVPSVDTAVVPAASELTARVLRLVDRLGLADPSSRLVVTPSCGLAAASYGWARQAMQLCREVARNVSSELG